MRANGRNGFTLRRKRGGMKSQVVGSYIMMEIDIESGLLADARAPASRNQVLITIDSILVRCIDVTLIYSTIASHVGPAWFILRFRVRENWLA